MLAAGLGYLPLPSSNEAPPHLITALGAICAAAGAFLPIAGVQSYLRHRRLGRLRREHPDEPWLADYPWNREGDRQRPFREAMGSMIGLLVFALFLGPFNVLASMEPGFLVGAVVYVADLVWLGGVVRWCYQRARSLKYGRAWVKYGSFPFFVGQTIRLRLGTHARLDSLQKIEVSLRFIREESRDEGDGTTTVASRCWLETLRFDPRDLRGATELPVRFQLPEGDYGTRLSEAEGRYWEVEMKGEAPGIDFAASFLVPVYAAARLGDQG